MSILQILQNSLDEKHAIDPKVTKFLMAYIECRSVRDAAKIAGLTRDQGNRILNKKDVQAALALVHESAGRKAMFDGAEILERTNELAQANPMDVFNADGTVKRFDEIPGPVARTIKKMTVREVWEKDINGIDVMSGYIKTVEFYDKIKPLEMLGEYTGEFRRKLDVTHDIGGNLAEYLLESEKRAVRDVSDRLKLTGNPVVDIPSIEAAREVVGDE